MTAPRLFLLVLVGSLLALLPLALLSGCTTTQRAAIAKFNASPTGQRLEQDATVAAAAAAGAAENETLTELQADGKVDTTTIGENAGAAAVAALIKLDIQRAQAKAPGK
ncbi:MAG: hypothetical protein P4L99_28190 [Chthoniobacter sp.]|nr:hypothetical protein [Chthoniobacter sp.]